MIERLEAAYASTDRDVQALVVKPAEIGDATGLMLTVHGFGNNRYQYVEDMAEYARRYNVVVVSPEYRGSGLACSRPDADGRGFDVPYDASFLQTIDVLNAVPAMLERYPGLDARRIVAWGGSQGGHIVLLASAWAPNTFSVTVDCCGLAFPNKVFQGKVRDWSQADQAIRDVTRVAGRIRSRVWVIHGTADEVVPVEHAHRVSEAFSRAGADFGTVLVEGGDHFLAPPTTRLIQTLKHCTCDILTRTTDGKTDFHRRAAHVIDCPGRSFTVDFSTGRATID